MMLLDVRKSLYWPLHSLQFSSDYNKVALRDLHTHSCPVSLRNLNESKMKTLKEKNTVFLCEFTCRGQECVCLCVGERWNRGGVWCLTPSIKGAFQLRWKQFPAEGTFILKLYFASTDCVYVCVRINCLSLGTFWDRPLFPNRCVNLPWYSNAMCQRSQTDNTYGGI